MCECCPAPCLSLMCHLQKCFLARAIEPPCSRSQLCDALSAPMSLASAPRGGCPDCPTFCSAHRLLFTSGMLGPCWPGEVIFQCHIFLPFHTVHGVLKARILKWFVIPFSSGPHFVSMWTVNFQMFKLDLEKAKESEIKLPTSIGSLKRQEFQKNIYFCFIDYAKAFDCVDHNKLWKIMKELGIPDHLGCLLRNLYAGQEVTVGTECGTTDWFQIRKGIHQGCILSPCLFNLYAEYIMWKAKLDEAQAGIQIARRNIKHLNNFLQGKHLTQPERGIKCFLICRVHHAKCQAGWSRS